MCIQATRDDVKAEVMKAPKRRIDNVITRLTDSVHLLQVHITVSHFKQELANVPLHKVSGTVVFR